MFHIGVLSAFFADSDFMTFLPSFLPSSVRYPLTHKHSPTPANNNTRHPNGHFIVVATVGRTLLLTRDCGSAICSSSFSRGVIHSFVLDEREGGCAFATTRHSHSSTQLLTYQRRRVTHNVMFVVWPIRVDWSWTSFAPFTTTTTDTDDACHSFVTLVCRLYFAAAAAALSCPWLATIHRSDDVGPTRGDIITQAAVVIGMGHAVTHSLGVGRATYIHLPRTFLTSKFY